jgi:hypothetical protein
VDVLLERRGVAVVEMHAVRARRELVRETRVGVDGLEDAVHACGMDPVEVDGVGVRARVAKVDAEDVVLGGADDRARRGAVVGPRLIDDALGDLDLPVLCDQRVLAEAPRLVRKGWRWIRERVEVVGPARRRDFLADHRGMAQRGVLGAHVRGVELATARQRHAGEGRGSHDRGHAGDQLAAAESAGLRHV